MKKGVIFITDLRNKSTCTKYFHFPLSLQEKEVLQKEKDVMYTMLLLKFNHILGDLINEKFLFLMLL